MVLTVCFTLVRMRASFLPKFVLPAHGIVSRWPGLAFALMGIVWIGSAGAAEDTDKKVTKLGFAFDQQAHDVVVAATSAAPFTENHEAEVPVDDLLQLPKYVVTGKSVPLQEREVLSPTGKLDLARKTYLTPAYQKTIGLLAAVASLLNNPLGGWQPNDPEAMALYEDTEQLHRKTEMKELADLAALSNPGK